GARQDLDRIARAASRRLDPVFITGSLDMQKALALRGAAVLILPPLCCADEIEAGRLVAVALAEDSLIETSLVICRAPDRVLPHAAEAVIAELERFLVG
ncbi:LysR family transcriptional regulator, partial [Endobacter medicaginis]